MKTNEELQGMTHDELVAYTQNLQRESEEYKNQCCIIWKKRKRLNRSLTTSRTWSNRWLH